MPLEPHPYADVFPAMTADEFAGLKADISTNGLLEPLVLFEGKVLDGRHRARVCDELGIAPVSVIYEGTDPVGFVVSKNLHRRNLSASQRAVVAIRATEIREKIEVQAQERMKGLVTPVAGLRQGRSDAELGELFQVSERQINKAKRIERERPEMLDAIAKGEATINAVENQISKKIKPKTRIEQIEQMASEGFSIDQMAAELGVSKRLITQVASKAGISLIHLHMKGSVPIDSNDLIDRTVIALEGLAIGLKRLSYPLNGSIDQTQIEVWVKSLNQSLQPISKLRKSLKEITHGEH